MMVKQMITYLIESGLSQVEIAARTGISQPTVSRIASGVLSDVSYSHGKAIERAYVDRQFEMRKEAA